MKVKILLFAVMLTLTLTMTILFIRVAECAEEELDTVAAAIVTLQPAVDNVRALRLARHFAESGEETEIDPLLLVAMAMRESSFDPLVESLERRGSLGEGGLMQTHGVSLRVRPSHCDRRLSSAECQIRTGARWLRWVKDHCGGSTARWVAAYGMRSCPTEESASVHRSVRIVRAYYDEIGGVEWR